MNEFLKVDGRFINLSHVISITIFDDGSLRMFNTMPNDTNPGSPEFWEFEGELATKIIAFFEKNSQSI